MMVLFVVLAIGQLLSAQPAAESIAQRLEAALTNEDRTAILADQPTLRPEILKILTGHAVDSFAKNNFDQALRSNYSALAVATSIPDQAEIARAWRRISQCHQRKDDLKNAVDAG